MNCSASPNLDNIPSTPGKFEMEKSSFVHSRLWWHSSLAKLTFWSIIFLGLIFIFFFRTPSSSPLPQDPSCRPLLMFNWGAAAWEKWIGFLVRSAPETKSAYWSPEPPNRLIQASSITADSLCRLASLNWCSPRLFVLGHMFIGPADSCVNAVFTGTEGLVGGGAERVGAGSCGCGVAREGIGLGIWIREGVWEDGGIGGCCGGVSAAVEDEAAEMEVEGRELEVKIM